MKFTRKAGGALALLILAVAGTWAAEVADVRFEQQGAQILSPEQIELNVQLHKGSQYTREILDADVKRLYNTGNFADVVSVVEDLPGDKVNITFKLRLKPRISRIEFIIILHPGRHLDDLRADRRDHLGITQPVRSRDDHLVPGTAKRGDRGKTGKFRTGGHNDLIPRA